MRLTLTFQSFQKCSCTDTNITTPTNKRKQYASRLTPLNFGERHVNQVLDRRLRIPYDEVVARLQHLNLQCCRIRTVCRLIVQVRPAGCSGGHSSSNPYACQSVPALTCPNHAYRESRSTFSPPQYGYPGQGQGGCSLYSEIMPYVQSQNSILATNDQMVHL